MPGTNPTVREQRLIDTYTRSDRGLAYDAYFVPGTGRSFRFSRQYTEAEAERQRLMFVRGLIAVIDLEKS